MKKTVKMLLRIFAVCFMSLPIFADGLSADSDSVIGYAAIIIIVPAIVAFVLMLAKLSQMKTAIKQNYADNYMKRETFRVERADDIFLYSNTVRTPRPKNKS